VPPGSNLEPPLRMLHGVEEPQGPKLKLIDIFLTTIPRESTKDHRRSQ